MTNYCDTTVLRWNFATLSYIGSFCQPPLPPAPPPSPWPPPSPVRSAAAAPAVLPQSTCLVTRPHA